MLSRITSIVNHPFFSWLVLALPAPALLADFFYHDRYYAEIMYESGLLATQLMVLALAISPLTQVFRAIPILLSALRWLLKRRRALGVAAFGYAAVHTGFYLRDIASLELAWLELEEPALLIGWFAFAVLLVLAATSNSASVRRLGPRWKTLQRSAYAAALLTAGHWYLIDQFLRELVVWMMPLALIQIVRYCRYFSRRALPVNNRPAA